MGIYYHFQHLNLTTDQNSAMAKLEEFLGDDKDVFMLKGYAGSGKTTLLLGLVEYLENTLKKKVALLAPTGRAAKVISQKTKHSASTIHKGIYSFDKLEEVEIKDADGEVTFFYQYQIRNDSDVSNTVFIIDEASMVSDRLSEGEFFRFGSGYLLHDLLTYSRIKSATSNTKIIFVGDPAQLPPIGMNFSPALDAHYLSKNYQLEVAEAELKEVKRQGGESGILNAATNIRKCLTSGFFNNFNLRENQRDIFNPGYAEFIQTYKSVDKSKIIIAYKNKTALDLNLIIRQDKYGTDLPIQPGDTIIIGGNNYRLNIMNGEFGIVLNCQPDTITHHVTLKKKGGQTKAIVLHYRWIELLLPDELGTEKIVKGYMLENYLTGDNYLTADEQQALYVDFIKRHPDLKPKTEPFKQAITNDSFFNPILLKYGYAVTCHKAQGGEWDAAFVFWDHDIREDFNFYESVQTTNGKTNPNFYRWAYTAVTRAAQKLFCINPPNFNSFSKINFVPVTIQQAYNQLAGYNLTGEEIVVNTELLQELQQFGLQDAHIALQDNLIKLRHLANKRYITITGYAQKGYEVLYTFTREDKQATVKCWINGQHQFSNKTDKIPTSTNSDSFFEEVSKLISEPFKVTIIRDIPELVLAKIEFDWQLEERFPFLRSLYNELEETSQVFKIKIEHIEHLDWRERYTFIRNEEKAVVDFE